MHSLFLLGLGFAAGVGATAIGYVVYLAWLFRDGDQ
jgi:hypothetical protein